jgi:hypothetical protein
MMLKSWEWSGSPYWTASELFGKIKLILYDIYNKFLYPASLKMNVDFFDINLLIINVSSLGVI